ncbi:hypothetical protein L3Y34_013850 [Caenorhabditis briggsae]|uniref:Uncharacterized protein n=1 Tax=Caenorhabditis briggsae TaxID=6238 RepID=A0AAE8ZW42_CAEBR|nr:hypothetical protein L3Y34_013850 [Caenorhabditis briggsae]
MFRDQPGPGQYWHMGMIVDDDEPSDDDSEEEVNELNRRFLLELNLPENAPINEIRRRAAEMPRTVPGYTSFFCVFDSFFVPVLLPLVLENKPVAY